MRNLLILLGFLAQTATILCENEYIEISEPELNYEIIDTETFDANVHKTSEEPALLFFGAEWCPHCRNFKPMFNEIGIETAVDYPKMKLYHLDCGVSRSREVCARFKMRGLPSIFLAYKGNFCRHEGKRTIKGIYQLIENCIKGDFPDIQPLPKGRSEYTFWDKIYYAATGLGDAFNDFAQVNPTKTIAGIVIFCVSIMGIQTFCINYFMEDEGYYPAEDDPKLKKNK